MLAFIDTNVLVYCTDRSAPAKQTTARSLVARCAASGEAVISTQVLIELFHALTRRQGMPPAVARTLVEAYAEWPVVPSDTSLVRAAVERSAQHRLSIWDAMVIEAAVRVGAETLYTEDLQDGQRIGTMTLVNPFT